MTYTDGDTIFTAPQGSDCDDTDITAEDADGDCAIALMTVIQQMPR